MSAITPLARILAKAQGVIDAETGLPIDVGGEVVAIRDELRGQRAEIERMESSLRFAAGVLSTMGQFRSWTPQDVYDWLKLSALAGKEDK